MFECDVAFYDYYNCEMSDEIRFTNAVGEEEGCIYFYYTPKDAEIDESTPVIAWVTHGGGMVEEEKAFALHRAANQDTEAIIIVPFTDVPEAICACIEDAKDRLDGKGNFDAVSGHGTSSGGRAMMRAALKSVDPYADYSFRFGNIFAYDPAQEKGAANFTGNTAGLRALAAQGTVLIIQTDWDAEAAFGGSGWHCNRYARIYSKFGGKAIVAESDTMDHTAKFEQPLYHNSLNWAIGRGRMPEDAYYQNNWYYYKNGEKIPSTQEEVTEILRSGEYPEKSLPAVEEPSRSRITVIYHSKAS